MVNLGQGDIYWVRFGHPGDSGPSGKRPAVVIQNNLLNRSNIRTTVVTLLTSNLKLGAVPGNVRLKKGETNLPKSSVAVVSQMATVDKGRLLEKIGTLNRQAAEEIVKGCRDVISPPRG
ncbi:MAG: type II toxin-antitoxin system PemK/MazF family toxin [Deltaproteobacteria bacterium]|uniref:mRNA interferase n=1 Tax=Candidatus Desulfacyla euxinica TaxID=2841693 RepID=A0A8J6MYH7_9DELT|nr:type II toxin-antitoxin system PemK/MazF family toxin [Candidatus Desulfacyla euxinica]